MSDAQAATLPTAGMTALRALEVAGLVLGKRVLVTGATGGVGRIAIQLARESGARVTALVRDAAASQELLRRLGAADVVENVERRLRPNRSTGVGGPTFGLAIEHVAARGVVVNIATPADARRSPSRRRGSTGRRGATIYTLNLPFDELASHASGSERPHPPLHADRRRTAGRPDRARRLVARALPSAGRPAAAPIGGKAVLHVD